MKSRAAVAVALVGLVGMAMAIPATASEKDIAEVDQSDTADRLAATAHFSSAPAAAPRIVNGQLVNNATYLSDWPFAVFVQITIGPDTFSCGGSLITDEVVITAAHCMFGAGNTPATAGGILVGAGSEDLSLVPHVVGASEIQVHPGYDPNDNFNDLALLHLTGPIPTGVIPLSTDVPSAGTGEAAGWGCNQIDGSTGDCVASDEFLREASLPVVTETDCEVVFGAGSIDPTTQVCAGYFDDFLAAPDTCQGDSGGPLVIRDGFGTRLIGLTSYGQLCGYRPGVYTGVGGFHGFIYQYTNAWDPGGAPAPIGPGGPPPPPPPSGLTVGYEPVTQTRVVDTRNGLGGGRIAAGSHGQFLLGGVAGVPADAAAVSVNLTAAGPSAAGYLTAYPCGGAVPATSTVNYVGGQPAANAAVVALGTGGLMCVRSFAESDVIVDVNGYFVPGGNGLTPSPPVRLVDSRVSPSPLADPPLPAGAVAMVLNVTAAAPQTDGYLALLPCGTPGGSTSTVNFVAGVPQANLAISPMSNDCIETYGTTERVIDYFGAFGDGGAQYLPLAEPLRQFDSRDGGGPRLAAGGVFTLSLPPQLVGVVTAANLNITATGTQGDGYMTVYPCSQGAPNASNLNYRAGDTVAASAFGSFDGAGSVCVTTSASSHLIVDLAGSFA